MQKKRSQIWKLLLIRSKELAGITSRIFLVSVLLSASVKRFFLSRMRDFFSSLWPIFFLKVSCEELWTTINPKPLEILTKGRRWKPYIKYIEKTCFRLFLLIWWANKVHLAIMDGKKLEASVLLYVFIIGFLAHTRLPYKFSLNLVCVKVVTAVMLWNAKTDLKSAYFGHFRKCQWVKFATDNLKFTTGRYKIRHAIFIAKHCFQSIFLYNTKSCCISLVLSFAYFSNVETHVPFVMTKLAMLPESFLSHKNPTIIFLLNIKAHSP